VQPDLDDLVERERKRAEGQRVLGRHPEDGQAQASVERLEQIVSQVEAERLVRRGEDVDRGRGRQLARLHADLDHPVEQRAEVDVGADGGVGAAGRG
jgi:hypothetical protein